MSGFFRKVAGAFIYLDDARLGSPQDPLLAPVALASSELIHQLGSSRPAEPEPRAASPLVEASPLVLSIMDMTAQQVFNGASLADSRGSASHLVTLIAGLAAFPREQQLTMVRAMDADEAWSEREVLEDAQRRQHVLRMHLQAIEAEKKDRLQRVATNAEAAQAESRRELETIDLQLAELQQRREQTISRTTAELSELEYQRQSVEGAALRAKRGIGTVVDAFSELITFFTGNEPTAVQKL